MAPSRRRANRQEATGSDEQIELRRLAALIASATPQPDYKEFASIVSSAIGVTRLGVVDPYDGTGDVTDWIHEYEKRGHAAHLNDDALKRQLRLNLAGRAKIWYQATELEEDLDATSWAELKQRLVEAFKMSSHAMDQRKVMNQHQGDKEDAMMFFEKRRLMGKKLGWTEKDIVANIITTLQPRLYAKLSDKGVETFDDLRRRLEKLNKQLSTHEKSDDLGASKGARDLGSGGPTRPRQRLENNGRRLGSNCFACGKPGHRASECRAPEYVKQAHRRANEQGGRNTMANRFKWIANKEQRPKQEWSRLLPGNSGRTTEKVNKLDSAQPYPCVVNVFIEGSQVEGILDTGASRTCLDAAVFDAQIAQVVKPREPRRVKIDILAAGNHVMDCVGELSLQIMLDITKSLVNIPVLIIKGLGSTLLLGRDFISVSGVVLVGQQGAIVCKARPRVRRKRSRNKGQLAAESNTSTENIQKFLQEGRRAAKELQANGSKDGEDPTMGRDSADARVHQLTTKEVEGAVSGGEAGAQIQTKKRKVLDPTHSSKTDAGARAEQTWDARVGGELDARGISTVDAQRVSAQPGLVPGGEADEADDWEYAGEWGEPLDIPEDNFADDPTDDYDNPYVLKDQVRSLPMTDGNIDVGSGLSEADAVTVVEALSPFRAVLAFDGRIGDCSVLEHGINTGDARPINRAPYPRSQKHREAVENQIQLWLSQGVIRESQSPWASQIVTVQKKDHSIRCCVDYRPLNAVTERDVYPLPTRDEIFASLKGSTYFSTIDLNQGYMQIRVLERDVMKTAFKVQSGFYEFLRMPFGLTNAPATFQRLMDLILTGLKWTQCLVYLDDIIVFGRDLKEHNQNLASVMDRLRRAGLTAKPAKCAFAVRQVKFLGQIVSDRGVQMDPEQVEVVQRAKTPTNLHELRSFVGLASYYRGFVEGFAKIAEPLTRLMQKNVAFKWTREQEGAFQTLKNKLITEPILCHFDSSVPVELRTDASNYALGAVLLHIFPDEKKRVIAYASRQLKGYEKNYGITEKECLAIVWAVEKFRIYLQGIKFSVVTDHLALTWLQTKRELNGRLMRWANKLAPYHFKIFYKSGKHHKDADYLSRLVDADPLSRDASNAEPAQELICSVKAAQSMDTDCTHVRSMGHPKCAFQDGMVFFIDKSDERASEVLKPWVPRTAVPEVINYLKQEVLGARPGTKRAARAFSRSFYTPNATAVIKEALREGRRLEILLVQGARHGTHNPTGPGRPSPNVDATYTSIAPPCVDLDTIATAQRTDPDCTKWRKSLDGRSRFCIRKGLLMTKEGGLIVLPRVLFRDAMYALHDDPTSGHCGVQKTKWRFNKRYYMRHASSQIKQYVKTCHLCQTRKQPWTRRYGLLQPIEPARTPFQRVGIDTLGPFKRSNEGNIKIVVATDYMTRFAVARAIPDETAETIAEFLVEEIFLKHGPPQVILSDQGGTFGTKVVKQIYTDFNVKHLMATPYHPQTNGLTERLNHTLATMMSMYVSRVHQDWDGFLPFAVFAYNSAIQASTGYSPHYLLYGFEPRQVADLVDANPEVSVAERYESLHTARELAIAATQRAQEKQKHQYDKNRYEQEFEEGDLVLVHRTRGYIGQTSKLRHAYEGPCVVRRRYGDLNYLVEFLIQTKTRRRQEVVHVSRLKRYYAREEGVPDETALLASPEASSEPPGEALITDR